MESSRKTGTRYEGIAAAYLEEKGYRILEKNYRNRSGEIDLIAETIDQDEQIFVFVEVKYRKNTACGHPAEAVSYAKQKKISNTAMYYLLRHGLMPDTPCRFDVIAIYGDGTIWHMENAFEFCGRF